MCKVPENVMAFEGDTNSSSVRSGMIRQPEEINKVVRVVLSKVLSCFLQECKVWRELS